MISEGSCNVDSRYNDMLTRKTI